MSMIRSLGKLFLSGMFIIGGWHAFAEPGGRVQRVASAGIPEPEMAVKLNGAVMVVGGIMLALDLFPRLASLALIGALVPTTLVGHPFWKEATDAGKQQQQTQFYKNLSMLGGLLLVLAGK
jgi:putative oxidoreductase